MRKTWKKMASMFLSVLLMLSMVITPAMAAEGTTSGSKDAPTKEAYIYVALVYMVQHPTRNLNAHVKRERAVADRNQMAVSRGKNPAAKGGLGAVLGLAKETPDGCGITDIAVCVVDGKRYLPDVFYDVNGNEVLI